MARLLIVDDDLDLSQTLKDVFELQDHTVVLVDNGADALAQLEGQRFHLVLLDWQLPDMTGIDVCRSYRARGGADRIVLLTGVRRESAIQEGRDAGVNDYLAKPFNIKALLQCVAANLAAAGAPSVGDQQ